MFVTVNELVGVPGLPTTQQGLRYSLKKSAGNSPELVRKRAGSKAFEYHIDCLPEQAREIVKARHYREVLKQSDCSPAPAAPKREVTTTRDELALLRQCPVLLEREVSDLTERQKQIADARALLAAEVERLRDIGMSRASAVEFIAKESRKGSLPENIQAAADIANARKGSSRRGVGERTLQEWLSVYLSTRPGIERLALLAPGHLKARKPEQIKWLPDFLAHWRKLSGPSLVDAWRSFKTEWQAIYAGQPAMLAVCPSYDAVRRAMEKLPKRERARGRISGSAALAFEVYQKRDWSQMPVNGCWIADGKSLDMKVAHPVHGRPFTPELTLVIDGRTRFLVGWSLALSENVIAVADAYRYAMKFHGKPLFVYSDTGIKAMTAAAIAFAGINFLTSGGIKLPGGGGSGGVLGRTWEAIKGNGGSAGGRLLGKILAPVALYQGAQDAPLVHVERGDADARARLKADNYSSSEARMLDAVKARPGLMDAVDEIKSWWSSPATIGQANPATTGVPAYLLPQQQKQQPLVITTKVMLDDREIAQAVNNVNGEQANRGSTGGPQ